MVVCSPFFTPCCVLSALCVSAGVRGGDVGAGKGVRGDGCGQQVVNTNLVWGAEVKATGTSTLSDMGADLL